MNPLTEHLLSTFTPAARRVVEAAEQTRRGHSDRYIDNGHLLTALMARHPGLLARLCGESDPTRLANRSPARQPASLTQIAPRAIECAERFGDARVGVEHLARAVLAEYTHTSDYLFGRRPYRPPPEELDRMVALMAGQAEPAEPEPPEHETPTLDRFGRDLTAAAAEGALPPVVGREREIAAVAEIVARRFKRAVALLGPPGVGKTAILEGLAQRIATGDVSGPLAEMRVVEVSATSLKGANEHSAELSRALDAIIAEVREANILLVLDEFHHAAEGRYLGEASVAAQLGPALARGEIAVVAATTEQEWSRLIERDPALTRRFERLAVSEPSADETLVLLGRLRTEFPIEIPAAVLEAAVRITDTAVRGRHFPDKAIDALDRAVARAQLRAVPLTVELLTDVVSEMAGVALGAKGVALADRLARLPACLKRTVIGQDQAVDAAVGVLSVRLRGLGIRPERPVTLLLSGPTGTGKTEFALALSEYLFGSRQLIRADLSEFAGPESITKLLGAPPGSTGYHDGAPLLAGLVARPQSVVLLDEVEKAHPAVHRLLLQALDAGHLTGGDGHKIQLADAIIVLTANLDLAPRSQTVGFGRTVAVQDDARGALARFFPAEFANRIDVICPFGRLTQTHVERIVVEVVLPLLQARYAEQGISLRVAPAAVSELARAGYSEEFGARELHRTVEREVGQRIAAVIAPGQSALLAVTATAGELVVRRLDEEEREVVQSLRPTAIEREVQGEGS
jgi:ATP-dependent Clp protease ATP-binding subunit ClpC